MTTTPLDRVRVLELAAGDFAATGALLGDWGADVVKLDVVGLSRPSSPRGIDQHLNRNKRSVAIDLEAQAGREVLRRLVGDADVFLVDLSPAAADAWGVGVEDVRRWNPTLIYARGSGLGPRGPERDRSGSDFTSFWARGGLATTFQLTDESLTEPTLEPVAGFGSMPTAALLAGGIAAAVYRRRESGEPSIVDASLLGFAAFNLSNDVAAIAAGPAMNIVRTGIGRPGDRLAVANAMTCFYRTRDERFLCLCIPQDRHFEDLCERVGRADLIGDPRFADTQSRHANAGELVQELDRTFAMRTFEEWTRELAGTPWVWERIQTFPEVAADEQVAANGLIVAVGEGGVVVTGPIQFDETPATVKAASAPGDDTDEVLRECGLDADELLRLRTMGVIR